MISIVGKYYKFASDGEKAGLRQSTVSAPANAAAADTAAASGDTAPL